MQPWTDVPGGGHLHQGSGGRSLRGNGPRERGRSAAGRMSPNGPPAHLEPRCGRRLAELLREGFESWKVGDVIREFFYNNLDSAGLFSAIRDTRIKNRAGFFVSTTWPKVGQHFTLGSSRPSQSIPGMILRLVRSGLHFTLYIL